MQIVEIDASRWTDLEQLYEAIYLAVGSSYTAGNVNALLEGIYWDFAFDDLNGSTYCEDCTVKPPFRLRIVGASQAPARIAQELAWIEEGLAEGHRWFREKHGRDVIVELEIA